MTFWRFFRKNRDPAEDAGAVPLAPRNTTTVKQAQQMAADLFSPDGLIERLLTQTGTRLEETKAALFQRLASIPSAQLPLLDERFRASSTGEVNWSFSRWRALQQNAVEKWASGPWATALLGLASFHASGRVREAAVRHLAAAGDEHSLGFLLVRANDWVEPVRLQAQAAALAFATVDHAKAWVRHFPLVSRLEQCQRAPHAAFVATIRGMLRERACCSALMEGLSSMDRQVARSCFQIVETMDSASAAELVKRALESSDALLRLRASTLLLQQSRPEELYPLCAALQRDAFMPIRRAALEAAVAQSPKGSRELLLNALVDRRASIREFARFQLAQLGQGDVLRLYVDLLAKATGPERAVALLGVGEVGAAEEFNLIQPFLSAAPTHLRKAALAAAARLDLQRAAPFLVAALVDESPGVSRQAERVLAVDHQLVSTDALLDLLSAATKFHARRNVFRLLSERPKWESLTSTLIACSDSDPDLQGLGRSGLARWFGSYNRSFVQPSRQQIVRAREALSRAAAHLSPQLQHEVSAVLSAWDKQ